jgi:hypothetical protein
LAFVSGVGHGLPDDVGEALVFVHGSTDATPVACAAIFGKENVAARPAAATP